LDRYQKVLIESSKLRVTKKEEEKRRCEIKVMIIDFLNNSISIQTNVKRAGEKERERERERKRE